MRSVNRIQHYGYVSNLSRQNKVSPSDKLPQGPSHGKVVNWSKLLGPFQNGFTTFFMCVFGMLFHITSSKKKSDIIFLNCDLDQFFAGVKLF